MYALSPEVIQYLYSIQYSVKIVPRILALKPFTCHHFLPRGSMVSGKLI
jgi:hypothetical protein